MAKSNEDLKALTREKGVATLTDGLTKGTQISYPSREFYLRQKPTSEHTIRWKKLDGTEYSPGEEAQLDADAQAFVTKEKQISDEQAQLRAERQKQTAQESPKDPNDKQTWVDAIINKEGNLRPDLTADVFNTNKALYYCRESERLVTAAEQIRGINETRRIVTIGNVSKTVLYRDATNVKKTLTDTEQHAISNLEFLSTWCISAAAAYNIAKDLDGGKKTAFNRELNQLIKEKRPGDELLSGKEIYIRKMQSLFSLLGAFFPQEKLKTLSARLEAERDLLAIEEPTELVATAHKNGLDDNELVYDIEFPNTTLSADQKTFFDMASHPEKYSDAEIGDAFHFYKDLLPWQIALIKRHAPNIYKEDRLRPTQIQFLPMTPNFWTRYTLVKPENQPAELVNIMSRCGALSPRIKASAEGIIQFQKMQYEQARTHFNLKKDDKLCYTSYKQNFYGIGADDSALKNISKAHEADPKFAERNPIFNIPMGRFAPLGRIINGIHHFFSHNKFNDNDQDPLTEDAYSTVERLLHLREHKILVRDPDEHLTIDQFLTAEFSYPLGVVLSDADKKLEIEIKLDLEEVYRHTTEIRHLRQDMIVKDNKRVGALRSVLFHKLCALKTKLTKLPGETFKASGVNSLKMTYQAYISGCKSNIDRGTLVTFHAEVIALKERERRKWWNKPFQPAINTPSLLNARLSITNFVLHTLFPFTGIVNFFTKLITGKNLVEQRADLTRAQMERELPAINAQLNDASTASHVKAKLLQQKAALIDEAIEADVSIEIAVCQSGHSRIMPAHGGSLAVSGIKDSVVKAVAPHLEDQLVHLTSQDKLSSHNHHLYEKCEMKDSKTRDWVSQEHSNAAENANVYVPPLQLIQQKSKAIDIINPITNLRSKVSSSVANVLYGSPNFGYQRIHEGHNPSQPHKDLGAGIGRGIN